MRSPEKAEMRTTIERICEDRKLLFAGSTDDGEVIVISEPPRSYDGNFYEGFKVYRGPAKDFVSGHVVEVMPTKVDRLRDGGTTIIWLGDERQEKITIPSPFEYEMKPSIERFVDDEGTFVPSNATQIREVMPLFDQRK